MTHPDIDPLSSDEFEFEALKPSQEQEGNEPKEEKTGIPKTRTDIEKTLLETGSVNTNISMEILGKLKAAVGSASLAIRIAQHLEKHFSNENIVEDFTQALKEFKESIKDKGFTIVEDDRYIEETTGAMMGISMSGSLLTLEDMGAAFMKMEYQPIPDPKREEEGIEPVKDVVYLAKDEHIQVGVRTRFMTFDQRNFGTSPLIFAATKEQMDFDDKDFLLRTAIATIGRSVGRKSK